MRITRVAATLLVRLTTAAGVSAQGSDSLADARMAGTWRGEARIVVNWTIQRTLAIELAIRPDGSVIGRIGDAALVDGRITSNRGWLMRALNWKTDWIVKGRLEGPVIAAEEVTRGAVNIPLNFSGEEFTGGLHTSGSEFGGKARMKLSAFDMVLTRLETPNANASRRHSGAVGQFPTKKHAFPHVK